MTGVVDLTLCNDDHSFDPVDPLAVPLEHRSPLFQSNSIESKRFESVSPVLFHVCRHHPPVYGSTEIEFKNVSSSFNSFQLERTYRLSDTHLDCWPPFGVCVPSCSFTCMLEYWCPF